VVGVGVGCFVPGQERGVNAQERRGQGQVTGHQRIGVLRGMKQSGRCFDDLAMAGSRKDLLQNFGQHSIAHPSTEYVK
jgi:hypothetical protein